MSLHRRLLHYKRAELERYEWILDRYKTTEVKLSAYRRYYFLDYLIREIAVSHENNRARNPTAIKIRNARLLVLIPARALYFDFIRAFERVTVAIDSNGSFCAARIETHGGPIMS